VKKEYVYIDKVISHLLLSRIINFKRQKKNVIHIIQKKNILLKQLFAFFLSFLPENFLSSDCSERPM